MQEFSNIQAWQQNAQLKFELANQGASDKGYSKYPFHFIFPNRYHFTGVSNVTVHGELKRVNSLGAKIRELMHAHPERNGSYLSFVQLEEICPDVPWFEYVNKMLLVGSSQLKLGTLSYFTSHIKLKTFSKSSYLQC